MTDGPNTVAEAPACKPVGDRMDWNSPLWTRFLVNETGIVKTVADFLCDKNEPALTYSEAAELLNTIRSERDPNSTLEMELINAVKKIRPNLVPNRLTQLARLISIITMLNGPPASLNSSNSCADNEVSYDAMTKHSQMLGQIANLVEGWCTEESTTLEGVQHALEELKSETALANHYCRKLVDAKRLGYLPDNFKF